MFKTELFMCCVALIGLFSFVAYKQPLSLLYTYFHSEEEMLAKVFHSNAKRVAMSEQYLKTLPDITVNNKLPNRRDLVVVIVTVARQQKEYAKKAGYLLQTAASMSSALKRDGHFSNKLLLICNVDKSPDDHRDAVLLRNKMYYLNKATSQNNMGLTSPVIPHDINSGLSDHAREQEILDYVYCLNASLSLNSRYLLVLEDDVLPMPNLLKTLKYLLLNRLMPSDSSGQSSAENKRNKRKFSFLKLYYPQRWQGYGFERDSLLELACTGFVGGGLGLAVVTMATYIIGAVASVLVGRRMRQHTYTSASYQVFFAFASVAVCVAEVLGRVNFMEFRRLSPRLLRFSYSLACCTQAMFYPREIIPELMNHLLVKNNLNKDLAIYNFSVTSGPPGFQLEPNLFLHTGMFTSLTNSQKPAEEFVFNTPSKMFIT